MKKNTAIKTKSPLKDKPLRNPGQSLEDEIYELVTEGFIPLLAGTVFIVVLAVLEWYRTLRNLPPAPITTTIIAVIFIIITAYKFIRTKRRVARLRLGRDGERAVGQYLETLRETGARIYHDIIGNNFNIDHVILSEKGIYIVETKTRSKPSKGDAVIEYDGSTIKSNGYKIDPNPLDQVAASSNWLRNILKESTGKEFQIHSVILFPGWYVENKAPRNNNTTWVLNPKALPSFLKNEPNTISTEDLQLACFYLSRYIRTS